jgi:hypothetical protein
MLAPNNFSYRKRITTSLPYEQISNPEVDRVMEVVNALKANAGNIHHGGCGYFAIMLQELIGGKIYHLTYMIREGMVYNFTPGHNFVIKGEYCYDYNGVCKTVTLFREKKLTRAYNFTQLQHIPRRDHYVLFNNDAEKIRKDYAAGGFYGDFTKGQLKRIQSNFANLKKNPALVNNQAAFNNTAYKSVA